MCPEEQHPPRSGGEAGSSSISAYIIHRNSSSTNEVPKTPPINNKIKAPEVRLIDSDGTNVGIVPPSEGIKRANEQELDLVQVTDKADPPVCRVMDFGKFKYEQQKKEKKKRKKGPEMKGVRLKFNTSPHDLETRAKSAEKFLRNGHKVKIELLLRGREKALKDHARGKIHEFLDILRERFDEEDEPIKIEHDIKKEGRGLTMIIAKT